MNTIKQKMLMVAGPRVLLSITQVADNGNAFDFQIAMKPTKATGYDGKAQSLYGDRYRIAEHYHMFNALTHNKYDSEVRDNQGFGEFGALSTIGIYHDVDSHTDAIDCRLYEALGTEMRPADVGVLYKYFSAFTPGECDFSIDGVTINEAKLQESRAYALRYLSKTGAQSYVPMFAICGAKTKTAKLLRNYYLTWIEKLGVWTRKIQRSEYIRLASLDEVDFVEQLRNTVDAVLLRSLFNTCENSEGTFTVLCNTESKVEELRVFERFASMYRTVRGPQDWSLTEPCSYVPSVVMEYVDGGGYDRIDVTPLRFERVKWHCDGKWHAEEFLSIVALVSEVIFFTACKELAEQVKSTRQAIAREANAHEDEAR